MGERRHTQALRFSPLGEGPRRATLGDGLALVNRFRNGGADGCAALPARSLPMDRDQRDRRPDARLGPPDRRAAPARRVPPAGGRARSGGSAAPLHRTRAASALSSLYARFSQTTPWGPALTQLALPPRRGEIASILRFHGLHNGFWRYCSHGAIEGGDIHIVRPGLLLVGWSGIRTTREGAAQFARWFADEGWETQAPFLPRAFPSSRRSLLHGCAAACGGLRRGPGRRFRRLAERARNPRRSTRPIAK